MTKSEIWLNSTNDDHLHWRKSPLLLLKNFLKILARLSAFRFKLAEERMIVSKERTKKNKNIREECDSTAHKKASSASNGGKVSAMLKSKSFLKCFLISLQAFTQLLWKNGSGCSVAHQWLSFSVFHCCYL
ncbi:hypothetical protein KP509_36G021400 [Ceratopteris richardii]|uniref:Uncharacterized protein n=1 Tax=Ceratopteris richardii TaxID=49495 RepID=A0A8T2QBD1_CERRI|nr:hypothetical protein KP509_36G021400 [Ceratopteris richardii]